MALTPETAAGMAVDPMRPLAFQVRRRWPETPDVFSFELEPAEGKDRLSFEAGQFNMLYAFGVGEVPISISGDPAAPDAVVHTVRTVGAVTEALGGLSPGETVGVRGPFGTSWPVRQAEGGDVLVIAGGLGIAPLRPALHALLAAPEKYSRIAVFLGARTPEDLLYGRELNDLGRQSDLSVDLTVDTATLAWPGHVGVVTTLLGRRAFDPRRTTALVCGPEIMMRFTVIELLKRGVPEESIFLSLERNMKCAVGFCGHCQLGPHFVCRDGPIFCYADIKPFFGKREV